jgi:hypothetical protein
VVLFDLVGFGPCGLEHGARLVREHQDATPLFLAPQDEVRESSDMVMVRGRDSYHNLPNKTLRAFLYAMAASQRGGAYSHVLKTDDDCYVRMDNVFRSIQVSGPPII